MNDVVDHAVQCALNFNVTYGYSMPSRCLGAPVARRLSPLPSGHLVHHRKVVPEQGGGRRPTPEGPQLRVRRKVRGFSVAARPIGYGVLTVLVAGELSLTNERSKPTNRE